MEGHIELLVRASRQRKDNWKYLRALQAVFRFQKFRQTQRAGRSKCEGAVNKIGFILGRDRCSRSRSVAYHSIPILQRCIQIALQVENAAARNQNHCSRALFCRSIVSTRIRSASSNSVNESPVKFAEFGLQPRVRLNFYNSAFVRISAAVLAWTIITVMCLRPVAHNARFQSRLGTIKVFAVWTFPTSSSG